MVIGFLNDGIRADWSYLPWTGMTAAARNRGVQVVHLNGNCIRESFQNLEQHNILYALTGAHRIDALVVWLGALSHNLTAAETEAFVLGLGKPVVTIERSVGDFPMVDLPNRSGMEAAVEHLAGHGLTRLGYAGMYENHPGFVRRLAAFRSVLGRRGLAEDPRMVKAGWESGTEQNNGILDPWARRKWLESALEAGMEGLVCVADSIAIGMVDSLERMGVRVPRDLALVSFDGFRDSGIVTPPVTTVRPDWEGLGVRALEAALALAEGRPVPAVTEVAFRLEVRQSCGCPHPEVEAARTGRTGGLPREFGLPELTGGDGRPFLDTLEDRLRDEEGKGLPLLPWQDFLTGFPALGSPDTLGAARVLVGIYAEHAQARRRFDREIRLRAEQDFGTALLSSFDRASLAELLHTRLPDLGVPGGWVVLFHSPGPYRWGDAPPPWSEVLLAFGKVRTGPDPGSSGRFPTADILPAADWERAAGENLTVESLHFGARQLGYLVLVAGEAAGVFHEVIRNHLANVLRGMALVEEKTRALEELRATQGHLIQSEKMAALGSLVAGVAHEINTPLGVAITASSFLSDRGTRFLEVYQKGGATKADLESLLQDVTHAGDAILTNLGRAADLVMSFKKVSADQAGELRRTFDPKEYLGVALTSLRFQWKNRPVEVILQGPEGLECDSYPGAVAQVVTNLLTNSLLHAFPDGRPGRITLVLEDRDDQVLLRFADDGAGIAEEHLNRVFEPFFTTKRGQGGTGLGLHIVYNVVTNLLGGTITFTSTPGAGTRFDILLPKSAPIRG